MKKKLIAALLVCTISLSLLGCSVEPVQVNVSNSENLHFNQLGKFVQINSNLVYDIATRIVYIKNYTYYSNYVYVPYYAPNGFPYRYDPEANMFEEINN